MSVVKFTAEEARARVKTERVIIESLMKMRDKEVDELVEEFVRNNEKYLELEDGFDIRHAEPLIKEIDEVYASYEKYKDKICYFTKQYDEIEAKRAKEMFEGMYKQSEEIDNLFKGVFDQKKCEPKKPERKRKFF